MARLLDLEAGSDAGRIVTAVTARERRPTAIQTVALSDLPRRSGADVFATVYEVLSPLVPGIHPEQGTYRSRLRVLATTNPEDRDRIGEAVTIDGKFHNFIGAGNERVAQELRRAGVTVNPVIDTKGAITGVNVTRGEVFTFIGNKPVRPQIR